MSPQKMAESAVKTD